MALDPIKYIAVISCPSLYGDTMEDMCHSKKEFDDVVDALQYPDDLFGGDDFYIVAVWRIKATDVGIQERLKKRQEISMLKHGYVPERLCMNVMPPRFIKHYR